MENVITLDKLIGLLILFCPPLLSILTNKRNDLAHPVMGTIFLELASSECNEYLVHYIEHTFSNLWLPG